MTTPPLSTAPSSIKAGALIRAAAILGGIEPLSAFLRTPAQDLRNWMAGAGEPPYSTFILAVDVIVDPLRTGMERAGIRQAWAFRARSSE